MSRNYTKTIDIPSSHVEYKSPEGVWDSNHYNKHYDENVKPLFDLIRKRVNEIESSQKGDFKHTITILWNKCRYFEMSCFDKDLRRFVAQSAKLKVKYNNMFVGGKDKLEAVVRAFNKKGIYCVINQSWI